MRFPKPTAMPKKKIDVVGHIAAGFKMHIHRRAEQVNIHADFNPQKRYIRDMCRSSRMVFLSLFQRRFLARSHGESLGVKSHSDGHSVVTP